MIEDGVFGNQKATWIRTLCVGKGRHPILLGSDSDNT